MLLKQPGYRITFEAFPVVNRDQSGALWATVFIVLLFNEYTDPFFPDTLQIFLHAHVVAFPIPIVNPIDLFAGIPVAFITKISTSL
jgi:hypothetical protein